MGEKIKLPHFVFSFKKKTAVGFDLRIIITRKIPRAVDRNRIKRVVREFCRLKRPLLPGNIVVCRVDPSAGKIKNAELFQELNHIVSVNAITSYRR